MKYYIFLKKMNLDGDFLVYWIQVFRVYYYENLFTIKLQFIEIQVLTNGTGLFLSLIPFLEFK